MLSAPRGSTSARRLPGTSEDGRLRFRLDVAAVRVGAPAVLVDGESYGAAAPDPLAGQAPAVLAHLNHRHADALAACLRAAGHEVGYAWASRLDAGGLTVQAGRRTPDGRCGSGSPRRLPRCTSCRPA